MTQGIQLPHGITLFERGWLSSNNILISGQTNCALIDSGYATHAEQTLALLAAELQGRPLDLLLNTHLHSDHCGGNAALQTRYPALQTLIPPGQAQHVDPWNAYALTYTPTGQQCPQFGYSAVLRPNTEVVLGDTLWQIHAAPGHDPSSVVLFAPQSGLLLSADALWHNGFGVVFPELDGEAAFEEVAQTLDLIASLQPRLVIPGHGPAFTDIDAAMARARRRLDGFVSAPAKHLRYAIKVLLKFKLLEVQAIELADLTAWAQTTPLVMQLHARDAASTSLAAWVAHWVADLVSSAAATQVHQTVYNA
jgi:glyoxylase-like metal-dependent hydrolase (beta-lactamase superfamily II)